MSDPKPYVDISMEVLSQFLTPSPRDHWVRCTAGLRPGTRLTGITVRERENVLRIHLDQDADPLTFVSTLGVEPRG